MAHARTPMMRRGPAITPDLFDTGSAETLVDLISQHFPKDPSAEMTLGRARQLVECIVPALVWLRDDGMIDLDAAETKEFIHLERVSDLADVDKFPDMPANIRRGIAQYLDTVPGYAAENGRDQVPMAEERHGLLTMCVEDALKDISKARRATLH